MPGDRAFSFILTIEGGSARADAERWANQIEEALSGITLDLPGFRIEGLEVAEKQLKEIRRLAAGVGKNLFRDAAKESAKVEEDLAKLQERLTGIVRVPEKPQWAEVLGEDLMELAEVADRSGRRTANSLMLAKDRAAKLDAEIAAVTAEITRLSQQRIFPEGFGLSDVSLRQYREVKDLLVEQNRLEAQGRSLGKARQARLDEYRQTMERVVNLAERQAVEKGLSMSGGDLAKAQTDYQSLIKYEEQLNILQTKRRKQTRIIADKLQMEQLALPEGAEGNLADFAVAMGVLAQHTKEANKAITSQSTRLGTYMKRITALGEKVGVFARIEQKLAKVFQGTAEGGLQQMAAETGQDAKQVESVVTRMVNGVRQQFKRLRGEQEGSFDEVVEEAKEAQDKVVKHSYIPVMVNGVLMWLDRMEQGQEGAFMPLIEGSKEAAEAVERSFQRMRMPKGAPGAGRFASRQQLTDYWRSTGIVVDEDAIKRQARDAVTMDSGPSPYDADAIAGWVKQHHEAFEKELNEYNGVMNQAAKAAAAKDRALRRMGVSQEEWATMGMSEKIGRSLNAAEYQWMGLQRIGNSLSSTGMRIKVAAAAAAAGMGLLVKQYLDLDEPLGRAARNLELNAEQYEYLKTAITSAAGTTSYFKPEEQAEGLYLWAAATGEVVHSTDELDEVLGRTVHVQRLAKLAQVDYGTAVEYVTDIQSQFQMSVDDTEEIVAKLVKVAAVSKAEVGDLGQAFSYAGAKAEQVNMDFDETAAILNILSGFGQRGTRAGRGLSMAIENLIAPSDKAKELMDELLGPGAFESQGKFIGMGNAVDLLASKLENLTEYQRAEFLAQVTTANATRVLTPLIELQIEARKRGVDVIRAEQKILEGGAAAHDAEVEAYRTLRQEIYGYEVATTSAMQTYQNQWSQFETSDRGRFEKMQARWEGAMANLGRSISEVALGPLADLAEKFTTIIDTVAGNETLIKAAIGGVGIVAAVGALTMALGKGLTMYADFKVVQAAATMLLASENMLTAAGIQAAQSGVKGVGMAVGKAAGAAVGAYYVADLASQGITGKGLYDLWSIKEERWKAAFDAEAKAAEMRRRDVVSQITELEEEADWLESYGDWGTLLAGFVNKEWSEIPEEYKGMLGMPSAQLMRERYAEIEEELNVLREKMKEFQTEEGYGYTLVPGAETLPPMLQQANDQLAAMGITLGDANSEMSVLVSGSRTLADVALDIVNNFTGLAGKLSRQHSLLSSLTGAMHDLIDPGDIAASAESQASAGWNRITGLVGLVSPAQLRMIGDQYTQQLYDIYSRAGDMQQWELDLELAQAENNLQGRIEGLKEYYDEEKDLRDDSLRDTESAYNSFRNLVSAGFKETPVTALQMAQSAAGVYEDQWDEAARRMRSALQDPTSEWITMIPDNIRQQGNAATQEWGKQWLADFYAGMLPDDVNWDAFARDFEQRIREQNGKNNLVDRAIKELAARGITTSRSDVMTALGLESPMQQMFFGGLTPEEAGKELQGSVSTALTSVAFDAATLTDPSRSFLTGLTTGMEEAASGISWTSIVIDAWTADVAENDKRLRGLGGKMAQPLYEGFLTGLGDMPFVESIVGMVLDILNEVVE